MIVYPAIDMRSGKVVRLREGKRDQQTVFSDDPVAIASQWVEQGAEWLHIVNLDGAFEDANDNFATLSRIARLDVNIQFGGGLRSIDAMAQALEIGVNRVVVGTLATQDPEAVSMAIERFGSEAVCVALDAKDGLVTTHGWTNRTDITPVELGRAMKDRGVVHALYTDVSRDGSMLGANIHETVAMARNTELEVIASGGISKMVEIQQLAHSHVVAGVVIGMALYRDEISLVEALVAAKERKP